MKRFESGLRNSGSYMPISFAANVPTSWINGIKGEVVVTIKKQQYYLWRAVDGEGNVLDVLLQRNRDTKAAKRFFRLLLKKQGFVPRVIVTDKLKSYEAAKKQVMPSVEHRQHKGLNNRAEIRISLLEHSWRRMRRFKSPKQAQRFLSAFGSIRDHFHPKQHHLTAMALSRTNAPTI